MNLSRTSDLQAAIETLQAWNRARGPYQRAREHDLIWNFKKQDLVAFHTGRLSNTPVVWSVATPKGLAFGLSERSLWLSLWGEIPKGQEAKLVQALCDLGAAQGKTRVVFGGDEFHFTPGIPSGTEADERLLEAARSAGFECDEAADFVGDTRGAAVDTYIQEARDLARSQGWRCALVKSPQDEVRLEHFLDTEFAGRWAREFRFWRSRAGTDAGRGFWLTLHPSDSNAILGFARMAVRGRHQPITAGWSPCALRMPLFDDGRVLESDACLGPIGVAGSQRGKGAGRVLLGFVLETLQEHDAGRTCIDWTNAFKYYSPLQFGKVRRHWTAWKVASS